MKLLYIATRYHTNQVPVMRGWNDIGAKVKLLVQYQGVIESHDYADLQILKPSWFSRILFSIFERRYNPVKAENLKIKSFIPDFIGLYKEIKEFMPDVVIIRNYRILGIFTTIVCRFLGIKNVVIYTQYPIFGRKEEHASFSSRLLMSIAPSAIFSPVFYRGRYRGKEIKTGLAKYFIPLVCDKPKTIRSQYCSDGKIRLLDIGKYREYKNHFFIVDALSKVKHIERFGLTIIGQLSNNAERNYYEKLDKYIKYKKLESVVHLKGHVDFKEMDSVYANHDVLLLASKNETAGMVILEAMSKGLCVVSSINCGLSSYIEEYKCGITFGLDDITQLSNVLDELCENEKRIEINGRRSQETVANNFSFDNYFEELSNVLQVEYKYMMPKYNRK